MKFQVTHIVAAATMLFLALPFIIVVGASVDTGSVYQVRFPPQGFTFDRYLDIDSRYLNAVITSLFVGIVVAILASVLGLMAAIGIVRGERLPPELLESFFRLPIQFPFVVTGAVFLQFYYMLWSVTGINLVGSYPGLILAHLFIALPYAVGACSTVLARMDVSLEEAAAGLGANSWNTFWQVTFPAIRPGVLVAAFYSFIISFGDVPVTIFLISADATTLPVKMFQDMQFDLQPEIFAVGTIVAGLSFVLTFAVQRLFGLDMAASPSNRRTS